MDKFGVELNFHAERIWLRMATCCGLIRGIGIDKHLAWSGWTMLAGVDRSRRQTDTWRAAKGRRSCAGPMCRALMRALIGGGLRRGPLCRAGDGLGSAPLSRLGSEGNARGGKEAGCLWACWRGNFLAPWLAHVLHVAPLVGWVGRMVDSFGLFLCSYGTLAQFILFSIWKQN